MKIWQIEKIIEILYLIKNFFLTYSVPIIWFIFSILFLYMTWREWRKSKESLESLNPAFFKDSNFGMSANIKIMGIDFESFAKELEKSNKESHKIAATAYFLAVLTALASFILTFI